MLFTARSAPETDATRLRSVRRALNSPVVAIAELPVGPAAAAIAIHADSLDGSIVSLAVRCLRTDDVVFFGARDAADAAISGAGALSFAEGMGFVFDDESESQATAEAVWCEFTAAAPAPVAGGAAPATGAGQEPAAAPVSGVLLSKFRWSQPHEDASASDVGTGP
jgi:hypothetical protein